MYWITMDAPSPRSIFIAGWNDALPYCTVTLEPRPKPNHPYPVALAHPALGLYVCQFIPQGAAGCVAEPMKCHPRWLNMLI